MDSELRYHATTGEWVLIAPKRVGKPSDFAKGRQTRIKSPKNRCPFEDPQKSGNEIPHFWFPEDEPISKWDLQLLPNKFPVVTHKHKTCAVLNRDQMYTKMSGIGHHDLVITRDHTKDFPDLSDDKQLNVFKAFQKRYLEFIADKCVHYVSMFHNFGPEAGASISHPHYQIIALPIVPNSISRSLSHSLEHNRRHKKCIHCEIIEKEIRDKKRIVFLDKNVIAFIPFAAKEPFQVNIFPIKHCPYFEETNEKIMGNITSTLGKVLKSIKKNLGDPDYNFFIHTAPVFEKKRYSHYHWHVEVFPKSNISAGFELGTGVEINPIFPEEAASLLKIKK